VSVRSPSPIVATLGEPALVAWGERIGREAAVPMVIALRGDLGAGKTTLARAIARGAGVSGPIPSPTFNLFFRYPSTRGIEIAHLDLYRIEREDEVWALGWSELPGSEEMVLIEWPERAESLLPSSRWDVHLEFGGDDPRGDELRRRVRLVRRGDPPVLPPLPTVVDAAPEAGGGRSPDEGGRPPVEGGDPPVEGGGPPGGSGGGGVWR
jgi:tRNA threonylcarbamoyladenosine biosynthesis protein TsaE